MKFFNTLFSNNSICVLQSYPYILTNNVVLFINQQINYYLHYSL